MALGDDIRFVLVAGAEVGVGAYRSWVVLHLAILPILLVAAGIWLARMARPSDTELQ